MLPSIVTVDQFEEWLGEAIPSEKVPQAAAFLAAASTVCRKHTGETYVDAEGVLVTSEDADSPLDDAVPLVVLQCAYRMWTNPSGASEHGTGPFNAVYAEAVAVFELTEAEKSLLAGADDEPVGVWVLGTTRGPLETYRGCYQNAGGTVFLPDETPGDPIPFVGPDGF